MVNDDDDKRIAVLEAVMQMMEAFEPLIGAMATYRTRLVSEGFDEQLAAAMAADMHSALMAAIAAR